MFDNLTKMRPNRIRVTLSPVTSVPLSEKTGGTQTQRRSHVETEADIGKSTQWVQLDQMLKHKDDR